MKINKIVSKYKMSLVVCRYQFDCNIIFQKTLVMRNALFDSKWFYFITKKKKMLMLIIIIIVSYFNNVILNALYLGCKAKVEDIFGKSKINLFTFNNLIKSYFKHANYFALY